MRLSRAREDYLKAVFHLGVDRPAVRASAVAERLRVSRASVSSMTRALEGDGLVTRTTDGAIELTGSGHRAALVIVRRHRLVETLLHEVLDVPWEEVHADAEALEHAVSKRLEARIDAVLGHPRHDPHGHPIPGSDGDEHLEDWPTRLLQAPEGSRLAVERVSDEDAGVLVHLAAVGVRPGCELRVGRLEPFGGPLWVEVEGRKIPLSRSVANRVAGSLR